MKFSPFRSGVSAMLKISMVIALFFIFETTMSAAGVLDTAFGTNGKAIIQVGNSAQAKTGVIQPDGKILVAGDVYRDATRRDIVLVRYNPNGSPDTSFGDAGKVYTTISNRDDLANGIALQPDGKIIVVGSTQPFDFASGDFLVVRYNANGFLDSSFGADGVVIVNQSTNDFLNAVAVHPDGKIVAVGGTSQNDGEAVILRLNPNGTPDSGFGDGGLLYTNYPNLTGENFQTVILQPNAPPVGRILVGGQGIASIPHAFVQNFMSSLYYTNGSRCDGFGNQCVVTFGTGGGVAPPLDLTVLPDGRILTVSDGTRRFLSNGTIDPTFNGGGFGSEIAVRSDGRFVIGGSFFSNSETRLFAPNGRYIGRATNLNASEILVQADDKFVFINSSGTDFVVTRLSAISSQGTRIADYNNDDVTDIAVRRQSNSTLYVLTNDSRFLSFPSGEASFEIKQVIPEPDRCNTGFPFVYWKSGNIGNSPASFVRTNGAGNRSVYQWGLSTDIPAGGDYNGDTCTDFTVFRPSDGTWYILDTSNNRSTAVQWGQPGDKLVPADYDYDGITDIAVFRPSNGTWYVRRSSDNGLTAFQFGISSDIPLKGDFDGDGRA
ncbi:MAG TPA: delta-60 repeat domain-containing protein, partial [Pyrinomonadaceae bacterium]|nr:delta-60 repeat domain-containing protein [Pyrinomonadaceae bacterium]